jgi:hypothetical protein
MSIYQHIPPITKRNDREESLFKEALRQLPVIYSHENTFAFQLTEFPKDYPASYNFPAGEDANQNKYYNRGFDSHASRTVPQHCADMCLLFSCVDFGVCVLYSWTFTESVVASFTKDQNMIVNLGKVCYDEDAGALKVRDNKAAGALYGASDDHGNQTLLKTRGQILKACHGTRKPPLTPAAFDAKLSSPEIKFTNGKEDKPRVLAIQERAFQISFSGVKGLKYNNLKWGDEDAKAVASVLQTCVATQLEELHLDDNEITDTGLTALTAAMLLGPVGDKANRRSTVPNLRLLSLRSCKIDSKGIRELVGAIRSGALPSLERLDVSANIFSEKPYEERKGEKKECTDELKKVCELWGCEVLQ